MNTDVLISFFKRAIVMGIPLLYGATGETITEKSGHLNLGIPGIMYVGAISGVIGAFLYENATGRNPDPVGQESWCRALSQNATGAQCASGFIFSQELNSYHLNNEDIFICHGYSVPLEGASVLVQKTIRWTADGWPELQ